MKRATTRLVFPRVAMSSADGRTARRRDTDDLAHLLAGERQITQGSRSVRSWRRAESDAHERVDSVDSLRTDLGIHVAGFPDPRTHGVSGRLAEEGRR